MCARSGRGSGTRSSPSRVSEAGGEAGARGETLAQMEEVFGVDAETMRLALSAYMSSVAGTEAKMANAIWFRDDGSFEPNGGFLADCASFAGAEVFAPFSRQ